MQLSRTSLPQPLASLSSPGLTRTESPSKRGSQRTPDPALRVRRHGVSSGEHRPFRGHFGQTTASWPACKLYSFESYPVSGESDGFRGVFRPNHGELDVVWVVFRPKFRPSPSTNPGHPAFPSPSGLRPVLA
ncbi:hypothetical protein DVH24_022680 [Malus domestica]|uniref:Uncharacterized protein n=1 Tax=Malus domestica TaxID=3750 RepID=A0A498KM32_MALDO|nr:hypothetical protein DVH24_022680 [Malus domestica]